MQKLFLIGIRDQEMLKFWKFDIVKHKFYNLKELINKKDVNIEHILVWNVIMEKNVLIILSIH